MLIIGLSGKKGSGKNTVAKYVADKLTRYVKEYSFAGYLKQICMDLFGLTLEQCYGDERNSLTTVMWRDMPILHPKTLDNTAFMTAREVLQHFGTDIVRRMDKDAWARALASQLKHETVDIALVTDVRFPNEVSGIYTWGGKVIRLTRNPYNDQHESETALDTFKPFSAVIDNANMTIEEQGECAINLINKWLK